MATLTLTWNADGNTLARQLCLIRSLSSLLLVYFWVTQKYVEQDRFSTQSMSGIENEH